MNGHAQDVTTSAAEAARRFRQTLGHHPTGVVIIAGVVDGRSVGMVVGSFTSVSLDPPLVAFFADERSKTWQVLKQSPTFCVNVLGSHQEELSRQFVRQDIDRFAGVSWRPAPATGSPIIEGVIAWIDCEVDSIAQYGDHHLVVGRVRDLAVERPGAPLIFYRGGYGEFRRPALISAPERDLLDALKLVDLARGTLGRLSSELGLEVNVTAAIGPHSVLLARVFPDLADVDASPVGYRIPLAPPVGPAVMAWATEDEIEAWFARSPVPLDDATKRAYRALLAELRTARWTWFTRDTAYQRVHDIMVRAAIQGLPKDAVHLEVQRALEEPRNKYLPVPLEPGRAYDVYCVVAPVPLPTRDVAMGVNVIGPRTPLAAADIERIGKRLRDSAVTIAELGVARAA